MTSSATARVPIARLVEHRPDRQDRPARAHDLGIGKHVLGRAVGVDVLLDHVDVSRQHAELEITPDGATIRDLGSKNGVKIDGRKVTVATLDDGARLSFGELGLVFEHPGARIGRVLQRSGEPTLRRLRSPDPSEPTRAPLIVPAIAAATFAVMLTLLLVFG